MRITTPQLVIGENDGFNNLDKLGRKDFGESLLNLVTKTKEEMVIALDAPWGEGKTVFVKMWRGLLLENKVHSIYIDAFANDYIDDPFVAIVSEIVGWSERQKKSGKRKLKTFKEKASKIGAQLLPIVTKIAVKAATLNVIKDSDIDALKQAADDVAKGSSEIVSDFVKQRIEDHKKDVETISSFRDTLKELSAEINKETGNPLVIIIDELDRCKPTYAVQLIELVKHLFLVENVVFVLVMHKKQLEEAVRSLYGQGIDARTYLQKFINVECQLPKRNKPLYRIKPDHESYINELYKLHSLELKPEDEYALVDVLKQLSKHYSLSLRAMERCFTCVALFYAGTPSKYFSKAYLVAFLAVMKIKKPDVYAKLRTRSLSYEEFVEASGLPLSEPKRDWVWINPWIKGLLVEELEEELKKSLSDILFNFHGERLDVIPYHCNRMDMLELEGM